ncbi:cache domain-containing protein [Paenarthrobacter sp. NPDC089989]|uniref:cache domain-containing protein n=1 Tax=unclassified Paenarthrobacter TaxID=2634190 RepID=UPI003810884B
MSSLANVLALTAASVGQQLERVFEDLELVADEASRLCSHADTSRGVLEGLKPVVQGMVDRQGGLVDSAGISVVPGLLDDADTWHQWWSLVKGKLLFIPHNLNPASVNFYDYTDMTWFERPLASGNPELIGPYIDFGGADMKIVTASRPVLVGAETVAIAGADLSMEFIEREFLRGLGRRPEHVALLTESGKVVASNSARFAPGTRFEGDGSGSAAVPVAVAGLAAPPWHVISAK